MGANTFVVYQDQVQSGIVEVLAQNGNAFNAASQGAIVLSTASKRGDFAQAAFFSALPGLVSYRDTSSSNTAVGDLAINEAEIVSVKMNRKIGPVSQTRDAFRKIMAGKTDQEMSFILGQQAAKGMQLDMLGTSLTAAQGALSGQVSAVVGNNTTALTTASLIGGLAALGDRAGEIVCWVMHSGAYYELVQSQISDKIFGVANFSINTGSPVTMNRPVIVTDDASLTSGVGANVAYVTLGLTAGSLVVENSEEEEIVLQDITGGAQLGVRYQGEFAYNLGVKGFAWKTTAGKNPLAAAVANSANWQLSATSLKYGPGVLILSK